MNNLVIGLTGPIASGKSEIAKIFGRRGAFVIDADEIGHQIILPQKKVWHEIVKVFGVKVLNRGGKVNRKKLGRIVFSGKAALRKLDRIMHPEMKRIISKMIKQSKKKIVVVNAAVLKEIGLLPLVDMVIAVLASRKTRVRRMVTSGLTKIDAVARVKSQAGASSYRRIADMVIVNSGSIKELRGKVKELFQRLNSPPAPSLFKRGGLGG